MAISQKNRQHKGQKKKEKRTAIVYKTLHRQQKYRTRTSLKPAMVTTVFLINVREDRKGGQEWTIHRNWQHWVHRIQEKQNNITEN